MTNLNISKNILYSIALTLFFTGVIFSSFYRLTESPPTWTDEGLIVQTAQNLSGQGKYGFQTAPGDIISPSFISTSYPVTFPIALSFKIFGENIFSARLVMAIYIILTILLVFLLFRTRPKEEVFLALALISTFPPLYGHGKNVLGEVPGLFFVLLSAIFLKKIEMELEINKNRLLNWIFFGLFAGLALSTKPIFILLIPALIFVIFRMYFRENALNLKGVSFLLISCFVPVLLWLNFQFFSTDSWQSVLHYYSNPHSINITSAVVSNIKDYVSHPRTLFAGMIFLIWSIAVYYRYRKKEHIYLYEYFLYTFSFFVFVFYFRNPPYYRYFFLAETLSLIFLTNNLFLFFNKGLYKATIKALLCVLVFYQGYSLYFNSWVADSINSNKSKIMSEVIGKIPEDKVVFFYQAPEAVIFLKHFNYYQYFSGTVTTEFGGSSLMYLDTRKDLSVITREDLFINNPVLFKDYKVLNKFDRYVTLKK